MPATATNVNFEQAVIDSASDAIKAILTSRLLRLAVPSNTTLPQLWDGAVKDMREELVSSVVVAHIPCYSWAKATGEERR